MIYTKWSNFIGCCCIEKNCDWSRKVMPLSNLTYSESRIELWNLQILKKCWKNPVSFCHRSSPVGGKALMLPWKLQELKRYPQKTCGCGQPRGYLIQVLNERSICEGGNFCLLRLVILKSVWYSVRDTFQLQSSWLWAVVSYTLLTAVPWSGLEHLYWKARLCVYFNWF